MFFFKNYPSVISISRVRYAKTNLQHMPENKSSTHASCTVVISYYCTCFTVPYIPYYCNDRRPFLWSDHLTFQLVCF